MILWLYGRFIMFLDFCIVMRDCAYQLAKSFSEMLVPPEPKSIEGEVVAIFGSSRGIGRDLAMQLAALGAKVACVDINSTDNELLVKRINADGWIAHAFLCDVTSKNDILETTSAIEQRFGPTTMLFHCCGIPSPRTLITDPPPMSVTLDKSVNSHFWMIAAILPKMKRMKHGHIIFLCSVAGISGQKHQTPLAVTQFLVQGLFESTLDELYTEKLLDHISISLVHLYPFVLTEEYQSDIRFRIPSAFGTIPSADAAQQIIEGIRCNKLEISIPKRCLTLCKVMKLFPRRVTMQIRELYDTGVEV